MARRYVVIGCGVAGLSAAETILHQDPSGHLTIVSEDPHGYYSRPGLAYYFNRTIPEKQLFPRQGAFLYEMIPNRIRARVAQIFPEQHQVILEDGRHLVYDRLLLATGSRSMPADFTGSDIVGVVSLYSLEDVRSMLKLVKQAKTAVVVGGGIIAIELAEGLAANRVHVDYFLRGDLFWSKILDQAESRLVERGLEHMGICIHHHTQVAQTISKQGVLTGVVTKTGEVVHCHILGVATGVLPQVELAVQAGLATDRGILVNEYLESSNADIFAAGDVARVCDSRTGEAWLETLWPNARRQGHIAGANMTGDRQICEREVTLNAVRIGDIITSTIGAVERMGDTDISMFVSSDKKIWEMYRQKVDVAHGDQICRVRVLTDQQTIVGAVVMGDQTPAHPLLQMIQEKIDFSLIYPRLADHPELGVEEIVRFYQREKFPYVLH